MARDIAYWVCVLQADFGLTPIIAGEIEFYLAGEGLADKVDAFAQAVETTLSAQRVPFLKWEKERGQGQYEIALSPTMAEAAATDIILLKASLEKLAAMHELQVDFSAKPYADQPGSGLHIHVHLENERGENVFFKKEDEMSDALRYSIGGLLAALPASMPIFAPRVADRLRFVAGSTAPTTISWGANNRTTALRLPDTTDHKKHIEHRVAGANANPVDVIEAILQAMHDGLRRKLPAGTQIYGDASDLQYSLPRLVS